MGFWDDFLKGPKRDDDVKYKASRTTQHGNVTDAYFGGVKKPDGSGKGHVRIDEHGNERIVREPYAPGEKGAKRDATLLDDNTPDRRR